MPLLPIESSFNKMFIKFISDDTIELKGFRIYYEFLKASKYSARKNRYDKLLSKYYLFKIYKITLI